MPATPRTQSGSALEEFTAAHGEFYRRSILHPLVNLQASYGPSGGVQDDPLQFDATRVTFDAFVTPPIDRDSFLIVGGLADVRHIQFDGVPAVADEDLYGFALRLGYGWFVNDDLAVHAHWEPSLFSDLDGTLRADDYQPGNAVVLAYARQSPDLFFKFGLAVNAASDLGFAPVLGAVWYLDPKWILDVLFPVTIDLHHRPSPDWDLTTGLHLRANRYHVRAPADAGGGGGGGGAENDIDLREVIGFVAARYWFDSHLSTELELGAIVLGEYEVGYGNGRPDQGGTLEPSLFAQWQLSWAF